MNDDKVVAIWRTVIGILIGMIWVWSLGTMFNVSAIIKTLNQGVPCK